MDIKVNGLDDCGKKILDESEENRTQYPQTLRNDPQ